VAPRVFATLGVLASLVLALPAGAQTSYAGTYRGSPTEMTAQVSTWGDDCGPRPQSSTDPERPKVEVRAQGTHLALAFPDRKLRTDGCWSPNPMVRVTSASANAGRWRAECRTPEGEAKRERGTYTLTAVSPTTLELVEESAYDWQLNESHCVAKVRITQRLTRGDAPVPEESEPEAAAPAGCTPGPLTKLRLRPSSASVAPGGRICFSVRGFDQAGCAVPVETDDLDWTLAKPGAAKGALSGNCFKAAARAAEAEGRFQVQIAGGGVRAAATVTVASTDLSDITARRGGATGDIDEDEDTGIASALGIEAAVNRAPLATLLIAGAVVLAAAAALAWLVHRRRRQPHPLHDYDDSMFATDPGMERPADEGTSRPTPGPARSSGQLICPQCRRGYPGNVTRCPRDGAVPIPYAEFVRRAQAPAGQPRTCPSCHAQLAAGAQFCGACGTKVGVR